MFNNNNSKSITVLVILCVLTLGLVQKLSAGTSIGNGAILHIDNFNDNSLDTAYWTIIAEDQKVTVEETEMEIKISGLTGGETQLVKSGLRTPNFSRQSFQTNIDFKLREIAAAAQHQHAALTFYSADLPNNYFRVSYFDCAYKGCNSYFVDIQNYRLSSVPAFGDEATAYHNLEIDFNSSTSTASAYVDNMLIGSITYKVNPFPMYIELALILDSWYYHRDAESRFDNFALVPYPLLYLPTIMRNIGAN